MTAISSNSFSGGIIPPLSSNMKFIIIYTTHQNRQEASKIISHLLKKRIIACANLFPIESTYFWKGKIESSKEIAVILKTRKENWEKVRDEIKNIHPYETPCIIKINVESNSDFANWICKESD